MTEPRLTPGAVLDELHKNEVTHVVWLPDTETNYLYDRLATDPGLQIVPVTREGESFAIAAGLWVGGSKPVVIIQSTGLFESGDSIRGLALDIDIPLVVLVDTEGGPVTARRPTRPRGLPSPYSTPGGSTTTWSRRTPTPSASPWPSRRPDRPSVPFRA